MQLSRQFFVLFFHSSQASRFYLLLFSPVFTSGSEPEGAAHFCSVILHFYTCKRYGTLVADSFPLQMTNRTTCYVLWIQTSHCHRIPPHCLYKRREHAVLCPQHRTQVPIDLMSAEEILLMMKNVSCNVNFTEL